MNIFKHEAYVMQIAKSGSITAAARELGISQPALSQALNNLEREIGLRIFNRRANPVTFTAEGEIYYRHICRMELLNQDLDRKLAEVRGRQNRTVVVGAPIVYVSSVIEPAAEALLGRHPDYNLSIRCGSLEKLIEWSEAGSLDCFISTSEKLPEHIRREKILQEEILLVLPQNSPLQEAFAGGIPYDLLSRERLIALPPEFPQQQLIDRFLQEKGVTPASVITVDQVSIAVEMTERGLGICFASREALQSRKVTSFPLELHGRDIYLAYDGERYRTEACEQLLEEIRRVAER